MKPLGQRRGSNFFIFMMLFTAVLDEQHSSLLLVFRCGLCYLKQINNNKSIINKLK